MATKSGGRILEIETVVRAYKFKRIPWCTLISDYIYDSQGRVIGTFTINDHTGIVMYCSINTRTAPEFCLVALKARFIVSGTTVEVIFKNTASSGDCVKSHVNITHLREHESRDAVLNLFVSYSRDEDLIGSLKRAQADLPHVPEKLVPSTVHSDICRLCDVTLKLKGGRTIGANKTVLMFFSPVFWTKFTHEWRGKKDCEVNIPDVSYDAMHEMLRFMYLGEVDTSDVGRTKELLDVAEQYDLPGLLKMCVKALVGHVEESATRAKALLPFAAKRSLHVLFERCELAILESKEVVLDVELLKLAAECDAMNLEKVIIARLAMQLPHGLDEIRQYDAALATEMIMYRLSHQPYIERPIF